MFFGPWGTLDPGGYSYSLVVISPTKHLLPPMNYVKLILINKAIKP